MIGEHNIDLTFIIILINKKKLLKRLFLRWNKRKFGKIIGNLTQSGKKQIICVTHDSDFIQGVFDAKCNLDVLKLTRSADQFSVISATYENQDSLRAKHNQMSYLQLAFLECGIIVEGATDRLVYENVFADQKLLDDVEYKFITAGGSDSISNPEKLAQDLNVPYAIILDIDNLRKGNFSSIKKILKLENQKSTLQKIEEIGPKLSHITNFKLNGLESIKDEIIRDEAEAIINELEKIGIFIVKCGNLESWRNIGGFKSEFPEKFLNLYNRNKRSFQNLVDFLNRIETYLRNEII